MVQAVCLLSGGMDSTTALAEAVNSFGPNEVITVSFNYGQRHGTKELEAASLIRRHYQVGGNLVDLSSLRAMLGGSALTQGSIPVPDGHYTDESMRITVVPNRNAIMLSIAFGIARAAGASLVYAGMHAGDHAIYPDCRMSFVRAFQGMEDEANDDIKGNPGFFSHSPIKLIAPFIEMDKSEIVTKGTALKVPFELTWSCYKGGNLHCGTCGTCYERREAFELAGIPDPTKYAEGTPNSVHA